MKKSMSVCPVVRGGDERGSGSALAYCPSVGLPATHDSVHARENAPPPTPLIKALAEAVGKDLAAYVEVMYPEAMKAASSTFKTSLRNHVYNDIMHVSTLHTEAEIRAWLAANDEHRKKWLAAYRKMRRQDNRTVEGEDRK